MNPFLRRALLASLIICAFLISIAPHPALSAEASPVDSLAKSIVSGADGDRAKALAIYRWIATNIAYDVDGFRSGSYGDLSPEGVLRRRRAVCSGYAGLFNAMARAAGLESVRISGYSKGYGYTPGAEIGNKANHDWNAVKIDGKWMLLDATWGAGHLDGAMNFVREYEGHYFLTPPEEFILDHLPEDPKWQLLARPVSKAEYADLVRLRPAFFRNGLKEIGNSKATIRTGGRVELEFSAPEDTLLEADLSTGGRPLDGPYTFIQREGGRLRVYALAPERGRYILRVYAKRSGEAGEYAQAIDYRIDSDGSAETDGGLPKTFGAYPEKGVRLFSPMRYRLPASSETLFKLIAPGAEDVMVVSGGRQTHLNRTADRFEGNALIGAGSTKVFARYTGDSRYKGLLEYQGVR